MVGIKLVLHISLAFTPLKRCLIMKLPFLSFSSMTVYSSLFLKKDRVMTLRLYLKEAKLISVDISMLDKSAACYFE
jgi:hypothetical protein